MKSKRKLSSSERQELIMTMLKKDSIPITASEFAGIANVSRQVIVQDVSILKAKNKPVIATSQGYIYIGNNEEKDVKTKTIVVNHTPEQTLKELYIIVDHGVMVKDVSVEHAVYGDLTASLRLSNRKEVDLFYKKLNMSNSSHLSSLTNGLHLHTMEADSMEKIEAACRDLEEAGILIK